MSKVLIVGGSVAGLATALALTELGHEVRILERDPNPPPDTVEAAHRDWARPTVPQASHSHAFASLGVNLLRERAPHVYAALVEAGAAEIQLGERMPPTLDDRTPDPSDTELNMLGARRSTFELVLRTAVLRREGVTLERGVTVRGLELSGGRVTGLRLDDGSTVAADLVVDASGRRTGVSKWLAEADVPVAEDQVHSCDITYYTRFYRSLTGGRPVGPLNRGFGAGGLWDHYTGVMFLGDNGTFSVSLGVLPDDGPMKLLRGESAFTAAVLATPLLAPWIAPGNAEPISDVHAMGGLDNSLRGAATTAQRPVPGLFIVGDAACTTNPAYGRGVSLALAHAYLLADTLTEHPEAGEAQSRAFAAATERLLLPWFHEAVQNDRGRGGMWRATVNGVKLGPPPTDQVNFGTVAAAAGTDAFLWRRLVRVMMMLSTPDSVYADEEVTVRVKRALTGGGHGPALPPAPSRDELVAVVAEAAG
ncbi:MAG: tryptophan 7-halogenase [Mycobacteriales bacterium]